MKTKMSKPAKRAVAGKSSAQNNEPTYFVVGSSMNYHDDEENVNAIGEEPGYPDFYEDTDNMNRYLW
ncbi:MAG: hypothetical protein EOO50_09950 [Flavobacterium sp.]|uniref:hypothetical protein n=1 Tax=Flavobacterium sp. TaxID=239 RepID=UPI0011F49DCA|nr:hypothetical protein [Flavobacterium sp.]RZJ66387.1 MAG: hypothetical protein EOO50_09950 [Flavobacterium sp.]